MLHRMFQRHNIMPHEFYTLEDRYKTFMIASESIEIDREIELEKKRKQAQK